MNKKSFTAIASISVVSIVLMAFLSAHESDTQKKQSHPDAPGIIRTNADGKGMEIIIEFVKGKAHNYPLMAVWIEDLDSNYIQTLYVSKSVATSTFAKGKAEWGHWEQAVVRRPAALPYWSHKYGYRANDGLYLPTSENPVPDAYTGATPKSDFILMSRTNDKLNDTFRVLLEINQPWDWNDYWTNNKYPGDPEYKTSSQPAVVYETLVDLKNESKEFEMKPIGHSHYSGKDGNLYSDLTTLTSALEITKRIIVRFP